MEKKKYQNISVKETVHFLLKNLLKTKSKDVLQVIIFYSSLFTLNSVGPLNEIPPKIFTFLRYFVVLGIALGYEPGSLR